MKLRSLVKLGMVAIGYVVSLSVGYGGRRHAGEPA